MKFLNMTTLIAFAGVLAFQSEVKAANIHLTYCTEYYGVRIPGVLITSYHYESKKIPIESQADLYPVVDGQAVTGGDGCARAWVPAYQWKYVALSNSSTTLYTMLIIGSQNQLVIYDGGLKKYTYGNPF